MPVTLNTIPEEAAPLIKSKQSKSSSAKTILAAAATVSFIFGLCRSRALTYTDTALQFEQRVPALIWAMAPWKEKLAAKKSA